ncbi:MAG: hypothetical protein ACQEWL_08740 [Pseudomonadota bacterium]
MKKYQQTFLGLLGLIFTASSLANSSPVKISTGTQESYGHVYRTVNVTNTVDKLNIQNVQVNRGQCLGSSGNPKRPYALPFGKTQTYRYMIYNGVNRANYVCDIIEIVVKTNQGDWTFNP